MTYKALINEIMWEYNCSRKRAIQLVNKYKNQGKYLELCEIVSLKKDKPDFS